MQTWVQWLSPSAGICSTCFKPASAGFLFSGLTMLTQEDFKTPMWQRMREHVEARLNHLRQINDQNHDMEKTASIRGAIAELKGLLALDKSKPGV